MILLGSPFSVLIERPQVIQISGKCFHHLRLNDLGIFRIHCHGQRGSIKAKIFSKNEFFFSIIKILVFLFEIFLLVIVMILDK
jgi:hypothetical protein